MTKKILLFLSCVGSSGAIHSAGAAEEAEASGPQCGGGLARHGQRVRGPSGCSRRF